MPTEFRQLVFSRDELAKALANYHEVARAAAWLGFHLPRPCRLLAMSRHSCG